MCTLVPQRVFLADKPVEDTEVVVGMLTRADLAERTAEVGVEFDPTRGNAVARIEDCDGEAAGTAGMTFSEGDEDAVRFFVEGRGLALGSETGADGFLGAFNLAVSREIALTAMPMEIALDSSRGDIVTRPDEISFIVLSPNSEVDGPPPTEGEWECVGDISDPVVDAPEITLTVEVRAGSAFVPTGAPIPNARVTVCLDEAAACAVDPAQPLSPGREALTDASGRARLTVETAPDGFDGQLIITGTATICQPP